MRRRPRSQAQARIHREPRRWIWVLAGLVLVSLAVVFANWGHAGALPPRRIAGDFLSWIVLGIGAELIFELLFRKKDSAHR